jgi:uncharacterized membrane protein YkgB
VARRPPPFFSLCYNETVMNNTKTFFDKYGYARLALFIIYFWFGILKVIMVSHAAPLVTDLLNVTFLSFIPAHTFLIIFGIFEMIIGIIALVKKWNKTFFILVVLHLITTAMPLFMLIDASWGSLLVPTLVGQYIIKNLALLSLAYFVSQEK